MRVADLYSLPVEPELTDWLQQFVDLGDLLASVPQLFARLTQTATLGTVEDGAIIVGPAHIGAGSIVRANSVIVGPVILGQNVEVSYGAIVRDRSYIGSNCYVDCGSVTTQSLVLNKSTIGEMASVRRSIVGVGCSISCRATLGSASDASGTFVGEMSVIGPECRLDEGSIVAAHSIIRARGFKAR
jgi:NDP-sugar pyrophosphorylase family protein